MGMCAVTGNAHCVGVGGWLLGGGFGPLSPKHGLGVDNLLSAKVVLADGSLVTADERSNADLFWALKGGGGNFGIVCEFTFKLHPVPEKFFGGLMVFFPWFMGGDKADSLACSGI